MSNPIVSVVMPAYNAESTILAAVESVLAQSMHDLELIVCNDASNDSTLKILKSVTDRRLRVVSNVTNQGSGGARDRATSCSSGAWVAFIDADDKWHPERLERLVAVAGAPGRQIVFDDIMICHDVGGRLVPWRAIHGRRGFGCKRNRVVDVTLETYLLSDRLIIQPLIPRRLIEQHNTRHSKRSFGEDAEYIINLAAEGRGFRYLAEPLYFYRVIPTSATATTKDHSLMRQCLEDCLDSRSWPDRTVRAFRKKISMLRANEVLYAMQERAREGRPLSAIGLLLRCPAALRIFPARLIKHAYYQIHRLWKGGIGR